MFSATSQGTQKKVRKTRRFRFVLMVLAFTVVHVDATSSRAVESPDAHSLLRELCSTYRPYQGIELYAKVTWIEPTAGKAHRYRHYNNEMLLRYRVGNAASETDLPPRSVESLVDNPGEPHLADEQLAEWWVAWDFDGNVGAFERGFITGDVESPPRRPWSTVLLGRERSGSQKHIFFDELLHRSPLGRRNLD